MNFQKIRSDIGIGASDFLLQEFANLLKGQVNEPDLLARFGDHSFTILQEATNDGLPAWQVSCINRWRRIFPNR